MRSISPKFGCGCVMMLSLGRYVNFACYHFELMLCCTDLETPEWYFSVNSFRDQVGLKLKCDIIEM